MGHPTVWPISEVEDCGDCVLQHDLQNALRQTLSRKQTLAPLFFSSQKYFGETMVTGGPGPGETDEVRSGLLKSCNRDSTVVAVRPDVSTGVLT